MKSRTQNIHALEVVSRITREAMESYKANAGDSFTYEGQSAFILHALKANGLESI